MFSQLLLFLLIIILTILFLFLIFPEHLLNIFNFFIKCFEDPFSLGVKCLVHLLFFLVNVFKYFFMSRVDLLDVPSTITLHDFLILFLQLFQLVNGLLLLLVVDVDALKQVLVVAFWLDDVQGTRAVVPNFLLEVRYHVFVFLLSRDVPVLFFDKAFLELHCFVFCLLVLTEDTLVLRLEVLKVHLESCHLATG